MRPALHPPWLLQTSLLPRLPRAAPQIYIPRRIATTSASNAAPVDIPKLIITPGSAHHNSLPSFLEYAKRTNLASDRTVYVGTHYEYMSALALMRLGFSLLRIGRRNDAGIDLIGHWVLAPLSEPLPVIIQCKARKISITPSHVREMEGSFQGIPPDWRKKEVLGMLVTTKKATKGVMEALGHSRWPMAFVMVSREGMIQQFVWNRAASDKGLEGVGVTVRHTPRALLPEDEMDSTEDSPEGEIGPKKLKRSLARFKNAGTRKDIQLTWMGSPIFPNRDNLDPETLNLMRLIVPGDDDDSSPTDFRIRGRGRPRKLQREKQPRPRGGQVPKTRAVAKEETRGRPKGSKNKPPRLGRPPGSKNKPKIPVVDVDTG